MNTIQRLAVWLNTGENGLAVTIWVLLPIFFWTIMALYAATH